MVSKFQVIAVIAVFAAFLALGGGAITRNAVGELRKLKDATADKIKEVKE